MEIMLLILLMGLATYIPRALPAAVIDKLKFSPKVEKFLNLIPYTAMAAPIFPGVLSVGGDKWYIGIIGAIVAVILALIKKIPVAVVVIAAVAVNVILFAI